MVDENDVIMRLSAAFATRRLRPRTRFQRFITWVYGHWMQEEKADRVPLILTMRWHDVKQALFTGQFAFLRVLFGRMPY